LLWGQALAIRTKNWRLQRQIDKLQRNAAKAAPARPAIGKPEQTAQPDSSLD